MAPATHPELLLVRRLRAPRRAWLGRRYAGHWRVYHVDPACGERHHGPLDEVAEWAARRVARLCGTCRRAYGAHDDPRRSGYPAGKWPEKSLRGRV